TAEKNKIIIGPGLRVYLDQILVSTCGILRKKEPNTYWVDSHRKRYIPPRVETVVGIVLIDIGSSEKVSLSYLAFEGATKSNRPDIKVGDLVFAKLLTASQDIEPELCRFLCKKGKLGQLPGDELLFNCSLNLIRKILKPHTMLLVQNARPRYTI
ncbi:Exosome complex component RRP40, partial [Blattella germanica]